MGIQPEDEDTGHAPLRGQGPLGIDVVGMPLSERKSRKVRRQTVGHKENIITDGDIVVRDHIYFDETI